MAIRDSALKKRPGKRLKPAMASKPMMRLPLTPARTLPLRIDQVLVDPALAAQLRAEGTFIAPRLQDIPLAQALAQLRATKPPATPLPQDTARIEDITIPGPDGIRMPARIYRPPGSGPFPVLLHFHGGGWVGGSISNDDLRCHVTARRAGIIIVSLDYRLAPEHPFPAGLEDAYAALLWLHSNAPEIGVDPHRIGLSGSSAGANLAIGATFLTRDRAGPRVKFQLLAYPVCDTSRSQPSHQENATSPLLTSDMMAWFIGQYLPPGIPAEHPLVAPLRATNFHNLPPALIITAECDPLRDEAATFACRLRDAGIQVTCTCYDGMVHGFITRAPSHPQSQAAIAQIIGAITEYL
jgi:acetyl esterase